MKQTNPNRCRTVAAGTAAGSTAIAGPQTQARVVLSKLHPLQQWQQQLGYAAMAATARPCVPGVLSLALSFDFGMAGELEASSLSRAAQY